MRRDPVFLSVIPRGSFIASRADHAFFYLILFPYHLHGLKVVLLAGNFIIPVPAAYKYRAQPHHFFDIFPGCAAHFHKRGNALHVVENRLPLFHSLLCQPERCLWRKHVIIENIHGVHNLFRQFFRYQRADRIPGIRKNTVLAPRRSQYIGVKGCPTLFHCYKFSVHSVFFQRPDKFIADIIIANLACLIRLHAKVRR